MSAAAPTLELPAGAAPAPRNQLFVATALGALAGTVLIGSLLAVWVMLREDVVAAGERFPVDYTITEVATNVMLMTLWGLCLFPHWAIYAAKRGDRAHTGLALGVTGVMGLAFVNAQAFVYSQMKVEIGADYYGALFYAVTGTMMAIVVVGMIITAVTAFRTLGGHLNDRAALTSHALYWYFAAAAYSAVWFVVYVTK